MYSDYYCQSCNMPIDNPEIKGTEKDGSKCNEFCIYCYANGEFVDDKLTLDDMKQQVKSRMEKLHFPSKSIEMAIYTLPQLKRWRSQTVVY